jgi:gentisate 1,2-dioxygenase
MVPCGGAFRRWIRAFEHWGIMSAQTQGSGETESDIRDAWARAHVVPLWETGVHRAESTAPAGRIWRWTQLRPLIEQACAITDTKQAERRVLALSDPDSVTGRRTVGNLNANLQILMPGETARPHRHTPNALRLVIEGGGGLTIVDGKPCPMERGDLVITPAWSWHEHRHDGQGPLIWLDALDVPLHQYLGTAVFEPGSQHDLQRNSPLHPAEAAFAQSGMAPVEDGEGQPYSPIFRFARADWERALAASPAAADGTRRLRFVNPRDGAAILTLMDCEMMRLAPQGASLSLRSTANSVFQVVEGRGRTRVGAQTIEWTRNDIVTLPGGNWISHEAAGEPATLFFVSDRPALDRLGLLKEERGGSTDLAQPG